MGTWTLIRCSIANAWQCKICKFQIRVRMIQIIERYQDTTHCLSDRKKRDRDIASRFLLTLSEDKKWMKTRLRYAQHRSLSHDICMIIFWWVFSSAIDIRDERVATRESEDTLRDTQMLSEVCQHRCDCFSAVKVSLNISIVFWFPPRSKSEEIVWRSQRNLTLEISTVTWAVILVM